MAEKVKASELKDKGNTALNTGNFDEAIKCYTDAMEYDSKNHVLFSNRSAAYCKVGKYEEALEDAETTIKLKSDWGKGYSRKGTALSYLKKYKEALDTYNEGLKIDPSNEQLKDAVKTTEETMSRIELEEKMNPFASADTLFKLQNDPRTKEYMQDPEYLKMLSDFKMNPMNMITKIDDPRIKTTLKVLLGYELPDFSFQDDDSDEEKDSSNSSKSASKAEEPVNVKLSAQEEQAVAEKNKGNVEYQKKNFAEALAFYDKAIELNPKEMTFLTNKAAVFFEMGDFENCIKNCEMAIEVGRENRTDFKNFGKAYARMGNAYVKLSDHQNAKKFYEKSLSEHRTQELVKKLQEVEKIIKEKEVKSYLDPEKALEEKNKGNEYFKKGDYPAAVKHYSEAILRSPKDAVLYSNRAACYQKLAEFQLALRDCETCVQLDDKFVRGYIRKGMTLLALKENAKAALAFQKAMELDPANEEAMNCYKQCMYDSRSNPEEMRKQALFNPEVQKILGDPAMRLIFEQIRSDPKALREHLKNPDVAANIQKLMDSGLITFR